jgi:uncharacterized membrane protein
MGGIIFQNDLCDELLAAHVQLQLDIMALHLVDREIGAKVAFDELTRLRGGIEGDIEEIGHGVRDGTMHQTLPLV